jgi:hypothetical protein
MAKDLRSFLDDCRRETPNEVIHITKEVNPANYDVTVMPRRCHGADQVRVRPRRSAAAYSDGPDDVLGVSDFTKQKITRRKKWVKP